MKQKSDHELWSLLVGEAPATYLSRYTLKELHHLGDAELKGIPGIGPRVLKTVRAFLELSMRLTTKPIKAGAPFRSSEDVYKFFHPRLSIKNQEQFYIILLDGKNRLIKEVLVSMGTLTASLVHPRDLFFHAIRELAAGAILVHNHPSGAPEPSSEDHSLTERLRDVGKLIGVTVLDHVIIGHESYYSFADQGQI